MRIAAREDLPALPEVERAAGEAFRELGMAAVADDDLPSLAELAGYQRDGRAWVHLEDGRPVGYLLVAVVDGHAHVEQVSVHPDHARRGIGRRLLEAARRWAVEQGLTKLSLTTFAEVPWNGPYYARLGFSVLPEDRWGPGLRAIRAAEAARGLDSWPRVVMSTEVGDDHRWLIEHE
ncbi:GNAT family N-acetyltransferase [Actinophytocola xanthii]|uniref:GNAT family N-acetyltransferase n=1 Tax=Actinophytocola xanthii TaxID=1912961 RepID=A0A1Q8CLJ6_9PSEU|nr:GNAT family N-acetyltransferase [Actinophytocola xanthii]